MGWEGWVGGKGLSGVERLEEVRGRRREREERGLYGRVWDRAGPRGMQMVLLIATSTDLLILALNAYRIQTWALEEARRRLEAEGILPDPEVGGK